MFQLTDKVSLVTGATGGIGAAIAKALIEMGSRVAVTGTRKEALLFNDAEYQKALEIRRGLSSLDEVAAMSEFLEYLDRQSKLKI